MRFFTLFMLFAFISGSVLASTPEKIVVGVGKLKTAKRSKLKVRFIEVTEDSRCPEGVNCIWSGNAKVKVEITGGKISKIFEFNTDAGPKGDIFQGWSVTIDRLVPHPKADTETDKKAYFATFVIERLTR
ncbi:MAG: hypothetical protein KF736_09390 [Acidobacteria bacterium]|nr:hypothetical protein [Acidobacteriota bacterium]MCW5950265.1 hypothetical protein [Pyrinomonadaceae bacterium]